ncbi:MAG TPA: hypothetical protein VI933_04290 [archaeon]|nr:hypothetical protein [archaeon]
MPTQEYAIGIESFQEILEGMKTRGGTNIEIAVGPGIVRVCGYNSDEPLYFIDFEGNPDIASFEQNIKKAKDIEEILKQHGYPVKIEYYGSLKDVKSSVFKDGYYRDFYVRSGKLESGHELLWIELHGAKSLAKHLPDASSEEETDKIKSEAEQGVDPLHYFDFKLDEVAPEVDETTIEKWK